MGEVGDSGGEVTPEYMAEVDQALAALFTQDRPIGLVTILRYRQRKNRPLWYIAHLMRMPETRAQELSRAGLKFVMELTRDDKYKAPEQAGSFLTINTDGARNEDALHVDGLG